MRARFSLVVAVAASAAFAAMAMPAAGSAAPDDEPSQEWSAPPDEVFEVEEIAARAHHEDVSLEEAETRMRIENAAVHIQEESMRRWPTTFGGTWIDVQGGTFDVMVAFTSGAEDNVSALDSAAAVPDSRIRPVTANKSLENLLDLLEVSLHDRELLRAGRAGQVDLPTEVEDTRGYYGIGIDQATQSLTFDIDGVTPQIASGLREAYGDVIVREGAGESEACSITNCRPRINGGIQFNRNAGIHCSTGFNTYGGSGSRFILSAGHCTEPSWNDDRWHGGAYYGWTHRVINGGRVDVERIIQATPGAWDNTNLVRLDGTTERAILNYISASSYVQGTLVGRSGATTDTDRGYITDLWYDPGWVPNGTASFVRTDYCANQGDSGGPVWRNNTAYGIHSGGGTAECPSTADFGAFTRIHYALYDLNLYLTTSPYNDPPIAAASHSCGVAYQCTFNGTRSSDVDGSISSWSWDFGDGTSGSGSVVSHTYLNGNTRTVKLTVRDNGGKTDTYTFTVKPKLL